MLLQKSQSVMADDDFQVIISNQDYEKLQGHENKNKELEAAIAKLTKENGELKSKNKDLNRSVYVRDSYIEQLVSEFESAFAEILGLEIISSDITKSFYQDVVSHEQNGISSIELRHALEAFCGQNKKTFAKAGELVSKFNEQDQKIKKIEQELEIAVKRSSINLGKDKSEKGNFPQAQQKQQLLEEIKEIKHKIEAMNQEKFKLEKKNKEMSEKNYQLAKQLQIISKKRDTSSEKSYVIKLMVDEYYSELQKNLIKIGGLSGEEIGTVVGNEMKGIVYYIENLSKKACKKY